MQPLPPTPSRVRFPDAGKRFQIQDSSSTCIDLMVAEIEIISGGDPAEVAIIPVGLIAPPKKYKIKHAEVLAFMAGGIAEPSLDDKNRLFSLYKFWDGELYGPDGEPHPWDVVQGEAGNCRIMSGLQVLALSRPMILKNAMTYDPVAGTCTINLRRTPGPKEEANANARFEAFTFSTALPCKGLVGNERLVYVGADTVPGKLPLWPCFFEKAFAVMWNGYAFLEGAEERALMSALGGLKAHSNGGRKIEFLGVGRKGLNEQGWTKQIKESFKNKFPMTVFRQGKSHNYGVVGVTDGGVVICDPNSRHVGDYADRWEKPARCNDDVSFLNSSVNYPMFYTWEQFFKWFTWVHIYSI